MLQDPLIGLLDGLISGAIAFFVVLLLAFFTGSSQTKNYPPSCAHIPSLWRISMLLKKLR